MLNKQNRVNKSIFTDIIKNGVNYYTKNISLKTIKTLNTKSKFAILVSKKELKTAVKRNLLKRRVLSILQKIKLKTKPQFSSVFFLKKETINLPYSELENELIYLLKKAKIL